MQTVTKNDKQIIILNLYDKQNTLIVKINPSKCALRIFFFFLSTYFVDKYR